jgi:metal-dependent amidase/aminoacylase/carboxypeptidase family protein
MIRLCHVDQAGHDHRLQLCRDDLRGLRGRNYPPTVNTEKETHFALGVMQDIVGKDHVETNIDPTMGAEDFSFMLLEKPGCYAYIGNGHG